MSAGRRFSFRAPLWRYPGDAAWYFVTLPFDVADEIADLERPVPRRGFGAVKVGVTVGATTWTTSVFPDTKARSYVLPVKKAVRVAEGLDDGDVAEITIEVVGR